MTARHPAPLALLVLWPCWPSSRVGLRRRCRCRWQCAPTCRAAAGVDDAKVAATAVDQLGLDLLRLSLGSADRNVALSRGHRDCAAMARAGAKGPTAAEMDAVLHIADPSTIGGR